MTSDGGNNQSDSSVCEKCGAFGGMAHEWVEGTCVLPHRYTKKAHPPAATIGHVCVHCVERHQTTLTEIVELYAGLPGILEPGSVRDGEETGEYKRRQKRAGSPSPVRLEAWAMLHDARRLHAHGPQRDDRTYSEDFIHTATPDVLGVLAAWVEWLYESLHWTAATPDTVSGLAAALRAHADEIPTLATPGESQIGEFIDDYDADLRWLRTALRRVHGLSDPRPVGDCLNTPTGEACDGHIWRSEEPGRDPRCDKCGREYGRNDLLRLAVQKHQEATA